MENIKLLENFGFDEAVAAENDKQLREIFNGSRRRLVEVKLRNNAVLSKHKAHEPITVLCLSGAGVFRAGKDLEDSVNLRAGTLITLEAEVEHEVVAQPELQILVTKFKKE
jgi:quercetin dioxygenase-like cupin family protein